MRDRGATEKIAPPAPGAETLPGAPRKGPFPGPGTGFRGPCRPSRPAGPRRAVFADLEEVELRRMRDEPAGSASFGESFLWAGLFRKA